MPDDGVFDVRDAQKLDDPLRLQKLRPRELLQKIAGIKPGDTCVDLGSGTGTFAIPMAEMSAPGGSVLAVDDSPEMMAHLKAKNPPPNLKLIQRSVIETGLPGHSADVCLAAFILHELSPPDLLVYEAVRLLKQGGRLVIVEWVAGLDKPGPPASVRISRDEIIRLFKATGLELRSYTAWLPDNYVALGEKIGSMIPTGKQD